MLLMGDPGVAKSQMLGYIDRLAPRSKCPELGSIFTHFCTISYLVFNDFISDVVVVTLCFSCICRSVHNWAWQFWCRLNSSRHARSLDRGDGSW